MAVAGASCAGEDEAPEDSGGEAAQPLLGVQDAKLTASDAASTDYLGWSVAFDGDTAVVGARSKSSLRGAAYVFVPDGVGGWEEQAKLTASDAATGDELGRAVSVHGDTAVIGARGDDDDETDAGAAYVFVRAAGSWSEQAKLTADDATLFAHFGSGVAVHGDTAVVGADGGKHMGITNGVAYVFTRSGTSWTQTAKLFASDPPGFTASFGHVVAVEGDTILVGAPNDDDAGAQSGSVYVFEKNQTGLWIETDKLVASDAAADDELGRYLSLDGDWAIAGAMNDDDGANNAGSAYVFKRDVVGDWSQQAKLTASNATSGLGFGHGVAIEGDLALVGATGRFPGGSAYVFSRDDMDQWIEQEEFTATDVAQDDIFGWSGALSERRALVGAPWDDDGGSSSGAAYVFDLMLEKGEACTSDEACQTGLCVDGVCCESACGDGVDDCQACSVAAGSSTDGECELLGASTVCRAAMGDCDAAETCDGVSTACPADALAGAGTECRAAMGDCDAAETCDGASKDCPADVVLAANTTCRAAMGDCDVAEVCDGASKDCPADAVLAANTTCRAAMGDCDVAEACDGASKACPADAFVAANTTCRVATGDCDVAEVCDGNSKACPADEVVAANTTCRAAMGDCDVAEACDGTNKACPADGVAAASTTCRVSAGDCDVAELCDGASKACPADEVAADDTVCRAAAGDCDAEELCDGVSTACPADAGAADGTVCDDGDACTEGDMCAAGVCAPGMDTCGTGGGGTGGTGGSGGDEMGGMGGSGGDEMGGMGGGAVGSGGSGGDDVDDDGTPETDPDGCSCRTAGGDAPARAPWWLALAALGFVRRRRSLE